MSVSYTHLDVYKRQGVIFATMSDWKYRTTQATSINAMVGQTFGFAAEKVPDCLLYTSRCV